MYPLESVEYRVLRECVHREPLFVLFWLVDPEDSTEVQKLLEVLEHLAREGFLEGRRGTRSIGVVSATELMLWVSTRREAGEKLREVPGIALAEGGVGDVDYDFCTTSAGLALLAEEDRPGE